MRERSCTPEERDRSEKPAAFPREGRDGTESASNTHVPAPSRPAGGGGSVAATPPPRRAGSRFRWHLSVPRSCRSSPAGAPPRTLRPRPPRSLGSYPTSKVPGLGPESVAWPPQLGRGLAGRSRPLPGLAPPASRFPPLPFPAKTGWRTPEAMPLSACGAGERGRKKPKIKIKEDQSGEEASGGRAAALTLLMRFSAIVCECRRRRARLCAAVTPRSAHAEGGPGGREQTRRRRGRKAERGEGAAALLPPETAEGGARPERGDRPESCLPAGSEAVLREGCRGKSSARRAASPSPDTTGRRKGVFGGGRGKPRGDARPMREGDRAQHSYHCWSGPDAAGGREVEPERTTVVTESSPPRRRQAGGGQGRDKRHLCVLRPSPAEDGNVLTSGSAAAAPARGEGGTGKGRKGLGLPPVALAKAVPPGNRRTALPFAAARAGLPGGSAAARRARTRCRPPRAPARTADDKPPPSHEMAAAAGSTNVRWRGRAISFRALSAQLSAGVGGDIGGGGGGKGWLSRSLSSAEPRWRPEIVCPGARCGSRFLALAVGMSAWLRGGRLGRE